MRKFSIYFVLVLIIGATGCDQGNERLEEKARIEGRASSEAGIQTENQNLAARSAAMESDLATRHRFYQAVGGNYEGELRTDQGAFRIRLTLTPSLYPYATDRVRQLDEITADINNLYFNAQIVQWNAANPLSAVGCRVTGIRPNLLGGEIVITSEQCPNLYSLKIADQAGSASGAAASALSQEIAALVREGRLSRVDAIMGEVRPSTNASIYSFTAVRTSADSDERVK